MTRSGAGHGDPIRWGGREESGQILGGAGFACVKFDECFERLRWGPLRNLPVTNGRSLAVQEKGSSAPTSDSTNGTKQNVAAAALPIIVNEMSYLFYNEFGNNSHGQASNGFGCGPRITDAPVWPSSGSCQCSVSPKPHDCLTSEFNGSRWLPHNGRSD